MPNIIVLSRQQCFVRFVTTGRLYAFRF